MKIGNKLKKLFFFATMNLAFFSNNAQAECLSNLSSDSQYNTGVGSGVLCSNSSWDNTAIGAYALSANTSGRENIAVGNEPLAQNTTGSYNVAIGSQALMYNTTGINNSAFGQQSLTKNTTGSYNTASGSLSLLSNTTGGYNAAGGSGSLYSNKAGNYNAAFGVGALYFNTNGSNNIAVGYRAGFNLTTGSNNIDIGNQGVAAESATIRIGIPNTHTRTFIAGIRGVTVSGGAAVYVKSDGQLGTVTSSRRYKENIQPMGDVSNRLMRLQPVTFRYKEADSAGNKPIQYGLIAEDVDLIMPELVVRNEDGLPETVAYHVLPSLLLNEYQKQHKELSDTKVKLAAYDDALTKEYLALLDAREKIAVMHSDMELMKQTIDRLIAVLPRTTAAMLYHQ